VQELAAYRSCRRTFATLLRALDRDIPFARSQMVHKSSSMLLNVYAGSVHPDEKQRLAALVAARLEHPLTSRQSRRSLSESVTAESP
jgi:hypothetical protein